MSEQTIVFGIHAVNAALDVADTNAELIVDRNRKDTRIKHCIEKANNRNISIKFLNINKLNNIYQERHQGIVLRLTTAINDENENDLLQFLRTLSHPPFLLILDNITDPHNLGACLRSADGAGVDAVITPKDNAAPITPVVRKVASGAAVRFFQVSNLNRTMKQLSDSGVWIIGTDNNALETVFEINYDGAMAIVLGNEGTGIRRLTKENCQQLVAIPMLGKVSSLNVSVAAGVILYQVVRQRILK